MIIIRSPRQDLEVLRDQFFPTINLYKDTRINNAAHLDRLSEQYFAAVVTNCLLTEVEIIINKKLVNTISKHLNIKFNNAQAAVFYRQLFVLPIDSKQFYLNMLRNKWIADLEQSLITIGLYQDEFMHM